MKIMAVTVEDDNKIAFVAEDGTIYTFNQQVKPYKVKIWEATSDDGFLFVLPDHAFYLTPGCMEDAAAHDVHPLDIYYAMTGDDLR